MFVYKGFYKPSLSVFVEDIIFIYSFITILDMHLREIKKEAEKLTDISKIVNDFNGRWLKPIRRNTNSRFPSLQNISVEERKKINRLLTEFDRDLQEISFNQSINNKLLHHSRYLIELKLTTFNGDKSRGEMLTNHLLNDDFINIQQTITDIKEFDLSINSLDSKYKNISGLLNNHFSLEENISFSEANFLFQINSLKKIVDKQKELVKLLGGSFVELVNQTQLKK